MFKLSKTIIPGRNLCRVCAALTEAIRIEECGGILVDVNGEELDRKWRGSLTTLPYTLKQIPAMRSSAEATHLFKGLQSQRRTN